MKYGMRERISGAVILLALAVIFIPMLFDEPPSREAQPEPTLTIEQPIEVERQDVDEPEPPASLGQIQMPELRDDGASASPSVEPSATDEPRVVETESARRVADPETRSDPIAELARRTEEGKKQEQQPPASQPETPSAEEQGDWAVQAGSFGEPGNAERFEAELKAEGFEAFRRVRDNDLTTVYVGPFTSSEAGEKARAELKQKANIQGLLIRLRGQE
ncbi:DedD protein [Modicisalibacter ilicicola DSM 19980]|uniref:DedD protein n=1 Tax=Modicisalibacter ilicicola DSM 19980 TaxID=1121942 RepID=A0A1M5BKW5_9GAMM|nr:SPOR domain-containing protein [Halomonas ilicicola]SHF43194.1 DedD protein [Halomonas ilicicola DSM 19980]